MRLARVVGTLVATRKEPSLDGLRFLVLKDIDLEGTASSGVVIAVDAVGAGLHEVVLYAQGSSARQTKWTDGRPCDATIMAIVDTVEADGRVTYEKSEDDAGG